MSRFNIRTEPFKAQHLIDISEHIVEKTYTPEQWREWAAYNEASGIALTAFVDGEIIACAGIRTIKWYSKIKTWKRKGYRQSKMIDRLIERPDNTMWVVLHERARNHKKQLLFASKVFIDIFTKDLKTDCVRVQIAEGFADGKRYVEHLGFVSMGTHKTDGFEDFERAIAC